MRPSIEFVPDPLRMTGALVNSPTFPGEVFYLNLPEAIGDAAHAVVTTDFTPNWTDLGSGRWSTPGQVQGELEFVLTLTPGPETVDIHISLTNRSVRYWDHSLAFTCFSCRDAPSIADFEGTRHWSRSGQQYRRLVELPRKFNPRPTIQAYSVEGAPPANHHSFIEGFQANPAVVLEDWLAIPTRAGNRLAAIVSKPALFLFQNFEFSCMHSGPSFGALAPGETGEALTRIYLVRSTLDDWYRRMRLEL